MKNKSVQPRNHSQMLKDWWLNAISERRDVARSSRQTPDFHPQASHPFPNRSHFISLPEFHSCPMAKKQKLKVHLRTLVAAQRPRGDKVCAGRVSAPAFPASTRWFPQSVEASPWVLNDFWQELQRCSERGNLPQVKVAVVSCKTPLLSVSSAQLPP